MKQPERRRFLQAASAGIAALAAGSSAPAAGSAADRIVVGVIGLGGMGSSHLRSLLNRGDVDVAWVCDVDTNRLAKAAAAVKSAHGDTCQETEDLRHVLDDSDVDAVFIATPDHWQASAAILALDAEKHVYVEKPCCHNIHEGRLMAAAVERTGRKLQVGTQSRSTEIVAEAVQRIREGEIGEILVGKAWNSQKRRLIGRSKSALPPSHLDFDTWLGPATVVPFRPNLLPGVWKLVA